MEFASVHNRIVRYSITQAQRRRICSAIFKVVIGKYSVQTSSNGLIITPHSSANCCCSIDAWGIFLNILLQDAPFLAFRLLIIIDYKIITYMNVFFACKNTLVIMLQLYRLVVVHAESRKAHKLAKSQRCDHEIYTISGQRKRRGGRERHDRVLDAPNIKSRPSKSRTHSKSKRKDTGYSTDTSESSTTSVSSVSVAPPPPVKKSHANKAGQEKSQKSSTKRRGREVVTSNRHKKKKPEKIVVEEGTVTDSNSVSVSEVAVVEVVKEKKNKRKKHQRKASAGSIDSD